MKPTIDELKQTLIYQYIEEHENLETAVGFIRVILQDHLEEMLHFVFDIAYERGYGDCREKYNVVDVDYIPLP